MDALTAAVTVHVQEEHAGTRIATKDDIAKLRGDLASGPAACPSRTPCRFSKEPIDMDLSRTWVCFLGLNQPLKVLPHLLNGEALRTRGRGVIMGLDYVGAPTPSFLHQLSEFFRVGHL